MKISSAVFGSLIYKYTIHYFLLLPTPSSSSCLSACRHEYATLLLPHRRLIAPIVRLRRDCKRGHSSRRALPGNHVRSISICIVPRANLTLHSVVDYQYEYPFAPPSWQVQPAETKMIVRCHCETPPHLQVFQKTTPPTQYRVLIPRNGGTYCHCNVRVVTMKLHSPAKTKTIGRRAYFTVSDDDPTTAQEVHVRLPLRRSIVSLTYLVCLLSLLLLLFPLTFALRNKRRRRLKMRMFRIVDGELRSIGQTCQVTLRYGARTI